MRKSLKLACGCVIEGADCDCIVDETRELSRGMSTLDDDNCVLSKYNKSSLGEIKHTNEGVVR